MNLVTLTSRIHGRVTLALSIGLLAVMTAGCSSRPPLQMSEQWCDMKSETVVRKGPDGRVLGEATVEKMVCSDNKIDRVTIKKAGIANNCEEYSYVVILKDLPVRQRGLACQKFNGHWEVIPNYPYN